MEATATPPRPGAVVALLSLALLAAVAAGAFVLADLRGLAGIGVMTAGLGLGAATLISRGGAGPRVRFAVSVAGRLGEVIILGALAWASLSTAPRAAAAAVVTLGVASVAAYLRVKGAGLGFRTSEWPVVLSLRMAAVALALLTPLGEAGLWAAAAIAAAEATGQTVRLAAQEEPA